MSPSLEYLCLCYSGQVVIRSLTFDELNWFLDRYYAFAGHHEPHGFALKLRSSSQLSKEHEAHRCVVLLERHRPVAGAYLLRPEPDADRQQLKITHLWFEDTPEQAKALISQAMKLTAHEAISLPLHKLPQASTDTLHTHLMPLGFNLERMVTLRFPLEELPPLGSPLVLESWTPALDGAFRWAYEQGEGKTPSDALWAYLKRYRGKFTPGLWFIGHETLDQDPVGYAFYGLHQRAGTYHAGIDGAYYLTRAGVLQAHRESSDMLRRLLITSMQELASISPLGRIQTTANRRDPKLIQIFESLGFETLETYEALIKEPL